MLPGDDEKCYKKIIITEICDLNKVILSYDEIEYAYVSEYKENYNLSSGKNSGLVPFNLVIKELIEVQNFDVEEQKNLYNNNDSIEEIEPINVDEVRYIKREYIALFEQPNKNSSVLQIINYGESVTWVNSEEDSSFVKVNYSNLEGWVDRSFLVDIEPVSRNFVEEGIYGSEKSVTANLLHLRSLPDICDNIIDKITKGVMIQLKGSDYIESDDEKWIKIRYNNKDGWVASKYLTDSSESSNNTIINNNNNQNTNSVVTSNGNGSLVEFTQISPHSTNPRNHKIDTITIHCIVGQWTVERLGEEFALADKNASSNYGLGKDGRIGMYVEKKNRSWCSTSESNDNRAVL